jgi:hypothetical protein
MPLFSRGSLPVTHPRVPSKQSAFPPRAGIGPLT